MPTGLSLNELIEYTDWERLKWLEFFQLHGDQALAIAAGPHGDGRFAIIGDLVRHIFSAEKRYIDRLSDRAITETGSIPNNSVEALFEFGQQSRAALKQFVNALPAQDWDRPQEFTLMNNSLTVTARKIVVHVLMHEIRHWAQMATLLRLNGLKGEFHDFLFSPVLGGELKRAAR